MASGPDMFMEGRQILSTWLLASGAPCIWELKGELGAIIRDVLEHPLSWDLSEEVGITLPPLSAFYHSRLHLPSIILNQPPSWAGLLELLSFFENNSSQVTSCSVSLMEKADKDSAKNSENETATNYRDLALQDSLWMLLMDFPAWLLFASLSLFQRPNGFHEGHDNGNGIGSVHKEDQLNSDGLEHLTCASHQEIAARYIAWHFSPQDQKLRDLVLRMLLQMTQSWLCIKDNKCLGREDKQEVPVVKRRKLMDVGETYCDEPRAVDGKIGKIERVQSALEREDALGHTDSCKAATEAVQMWLLNFQDCCCLLDSYSQAGPRHTAASGNKQQAKRRLVMGTALGDHTLGTEQGSQQPETTFSQCKSFSFFDTFPLVALLCCPRLHNNDAVVHLILHFIMMGSRFSPLKVDVSEVKETSEVSTSGNNSVAYQAAMKGLACREPSHRTEDFRDICQSPFCLSFSLHTSSAASGAARVFRFLETLDLLENSFFVNGCNGLGWLGRFKEIIARQLQMCISRWSQKVDNAGLTVLDDLRCRAAIWAVRTGLESQTLRAFKEVLQRLDILIASSVVEDTLEDALVD